MMCENMHLVQVAEAAEGMQVLKAEAESEKAAANALAKGAASRARQVPLSQGTSPHKEWIGCFYLAPATLTIFHLHFTMQAEARITNERIRRESHALQKLEGQMISMKYVTSTSAMYT